MNIYIIMKIRLNLFLFHYCATKVFVMKQYFLKGWLCKRHRSSQKPFVSKLLKDLLSVLCYVCLEVIKTCRHYYISGMNLCVCTSFYTWWRALKFGMFTKFTITYVVVVSLPWDGSTRTPRRVAQRFLNFQRINSCINPVEIVLCILNKSNHISQKLFLHNRICRHVQTYWRVPARIFYWGIALFVEVIFYKSRVRISYVMHR